MPNKRFSRFRLSNESKRWIAFDAVIRAFFQAQLEFDRRFMCVDPSTIPLATNVLSNISVVYSSDDKFVALVCEWLSIRTNYSTVERTPTIFRRRQITLNCC